MDDKPQSHPGGADDKEKKKKRPTIQFYQPPNSRNCSTKKAEYQKESVADAKHLDNTDPSRKSEAASNADSSSISKQRSYEKPEEKRVRSFKQQSLSAKKSDQSGKTPSSLTDVKPQSQAQAPPKPKAIGLEVENVKPRIDILNSSLEQLELSRSARQTAGGILKINLQEIENLNKSTER
jgi:hypothetical protein